MLNVGAGSKSIPMPERYAGWTKVYLVADAESDVDIIADARNMAAIRSGSYDAVYLSDCLEHFDSWETEAVLAEWGGC